MYKTINDTGDDNKDYICRKPQYVLGKQYPNKQEWTPFPFTFSLQCLQNLFNCSLYEDPIPKDPNGIFNSYLFHPMQYMGVVHANDVTNMSPIIKEYFQQHL